MRLWAGGSINGVEDVCVNDAEGVAEFGCGGWIIDG